MSDQNQEIEKQKAAVGRVAESARAFLRVWDEFDGDPSCVGEYLDALIDAVDKTGDAEPPLPFCAICGGNRTMIRGRHPSIEPRAVCPTCAIERLEAIHEMSEHQRPVAGYPTWVMEKAP